MAKLRINHNLTDAEFIDALEKALSKAGENSEGPHAELTDKFAQTIRDKSYEAHEIVVKSMIKEIKKVVNS